MTSSFPLMNLARELGLPYGDVLLYSDFLDPKLWTLNPHQTDAARRIHELTNETRTKLVQGILDASERLRPSTSG